MFRTTHHRLLAYKRFFRSHSRLVLFLTLMLSGFLIGCLLFRLFGYTESDYLGTILTVKPLASGLRPLAAALYNTCFAPTVLLVILFLSGLSACGLPVVLAVPLFFGMGVGMSEAYYYSTGWHGVLLVILLLLPPTVCKAIVLLMASAESLRMTVRFCGQLLPQSTACGGMQKEFRLYLLRFLIFLFMIIATGILDIILRLLFQSWLL